MYFVSINDFNNKAALKSFDCSQKPLNDYLFHYAQKNDKMGFGKTFLLVNKEKTEIFGYYTLANAQGKFEEIPNQELNIPKYPIPAVRIARLAVAEKYQGQGLGKLLVKHAFTKIIKASEIIGIFLICVDSKPEAIAFYKKFGFKPFENKENALYIPLETVKKAYIER